MSGKSPNHNSAIKGKVIIASLLACIAVGASLYISKFTFGKILTTVDSLARPNIKLQLVNTVFKDVVGLDQLQRRQVLDRRAANYNPLLMESEQLQHRLDTLRSMSLQSTTQVVRIDSMKKLLYQRDLLFLKYFKLRTALVKNDTLAGQVGKLGDLIAAAKHNIDKNLVTTRRATKTTIDTIDDESKTTLWKRVFNKRKPRQVQKQVEEVLNVRMDTVQMGNSGDSLARIGLSISRIAHSSQSQRDVLQQWQAALNAAGSKLIDQLADILTDIEAEELAHDTQQNAAANKLVRKGVTNITIVLVILIIGIIVLIYRIFADIAQSNQYRRELVTAKEAAEAAGLVKQRFLANMSHELRTPLQTIVGVSEQIRNDIRPQPQALENIYQSSLHLLQIVNEVLDYSRIISGKYTLEVKPFNMQTLLGEVREMIQVQVATRQLTLHYNIAIDGSANYLGDPFRLKQILLNLLGNAVKFTDVGSVTLAVTEYTPEDENTLFTFRVSDTGIGMQPEDLEVIFNEFEQARNAGHREGTGLGLSIVHTMVALQHGTINVASTPGKGTEFTVVLPYTKTDTIVDKPDVAIARTHAGHVWVVDDDRFILNLCDTILAKYGIAHTCFSSALLALDTPFPADICTVFLDVRMAEMDGVTLCRNLQKRDSTIRPKYVALTAHAFADEQQDILRSGFDDLVVKPFLEHDFMEAIEEQQPAQQPLYIDLSTIIKMTGRDEEIVTLSLQSFIEECQQDIADARQNLQSGDTEALADTLHKLAGRCGILGLHPLYHTIRGAEVALRTDPNLDNVRHNMAGIYTHVAAVIHTLLGLLRSGNLLQSVGKANTIIVVYP